MAEITVMMKKVNAPSMAGAIRDKCMECSCNNYASVRDCNVIDCPLWPYRFGANPRAAINRLSKSYKVKMI